MTFEEWKRWMDKDFTFLRGVAEGLPDCNGRARLVILQKLDAIWENVKRLGLEYGFVETDSQEEKV